MNAPGDWLSFGLSKEVRRRPGELIEEAKAVIANQPVSAFRKFHKDLLECDVVLGGAAYRALFRRRGMTVYLLDIVQGDKPFNRDALKMFFE